MRSLLFVPADSERKVAKALAGPSDVVILDLEDSVSLAGKSAAREIAARALQSRAPGGPKVFVRVNPLTSGLVDADLEAVLATLPDGIMQPKTNCADDVAALRERLPTDMPVIAIATETAQSLFGLGTYAGLQPPLAGLTWGAEDLSNELGAVTSRDGSGALTPPYQLARTLCLAGARAAGVEPVDTVCVDFSDPGALERECHEAVRDGFTAKMAIHPNQVETINRIFTPSPEDIAHARHIVATFQQAGDPGVVAIDGKMYDRPHLERARRLIARSARYATG